jgi:pyruvate/2-oxoglutarate dehydrogenase complex dihydrolipoamide acyltransferase (E2) component
MAEPNDVVDVGEVIAKIETDSKSVNLDKSSKHSIDEKFIKEPIEKPQEVKEKDVQIKSEKKSFNISSSTKEPILSPAVTKLANQEGVSFGELGIN